MTRRWLALAAGLAAFEGSSEKQADEQGTDAGVLPEYGLRISAGLGYGCKAVDDKPWNPQPHSKEIDRVDGATCWLESSEVGILSVAGFAGGTGQAEGSVVFTVEPLY